MKVSASFLSIKNNLKSNIKLLCKTSIDYIHLDIMDGKFVQNKTFNYLKIKYLLVNTKKKKDIHLMVNDVEKYINKFSKLKPSFLTFHLESPNNCLEMINLIKDKNIKVGISIKPNTKLDDLIPFLPFVDLVLVMSVEPGKGGQEFIGSTIDKIDELNRIRNDKNYKYLIEVDGGINDTNIKLLKNADIAVVGSFITNSNNYQEQINKLR